MVLTFTSLSIPHVDAFSKALDSTGAPDDQDEGQQMASQYFTMFIEDHSATSHLGFFCNSMRLGDSRFKSCDHVQHALWWYNGAMEIGAMAGPPFMTAGELLLKGDPTMSALRAFWGGKETGPYHQTSPTGPVSMPALYVCGSKDSYIYCNKPYALKTKEYCPAGYSYLEANCDHDLLSCKDKSETQKVVDAIVDHIKGEGREVV